MANNAAFQHNQADAQQAMANMAMLQMQKQQQMGS